MSEKNSQPVREPFDLDKFQVHGEKISSLAEGIANAVSPGMSIHINIGAYANAAIREIIRQFWNKDPGFTLISAGVTNPFEIAFVCSGLVKKVVTSNYGYTYPTPRPVPLLQEMEKSGRIRVESWSLYTLEQRLMAGALGVGFLPTKSLVGTHLEADNAHAFRVVDDPFGAGKRVGLVKALVPDVSIVHGCISDPDGNLLTAPPYFASVWGPRASKGGIIATVEKVVSWECIRRHSALVKVPAYLVQHVCPVLMGSHPQGLGSEAIGVEGGYGEDYDFIVEFVKASANEKGLRKWIEEWVLDCPTQDEYLCKLGHQRLSYLKGKSSSDAWKYEVLRSSSHSKARSGYNPTEWMVVAGAREIREIVKSNGYTTMLAGIGSPALSAWLAFYLLNEEGYKVQMLTGLGMVGYSPLPGDPFLMNLSNVMTCSMLTDTVEVYGTIVAGEGSRCLSVLGTAEIDQFGNINTVRVGGALFIGVGGAGDAVNARETVVIAKQARSRFLERVSYVGCRGEKIGTLVTDLGVYKKAVGEESFTLKKILVDEGFTTVENKIAEIREKCGWELKLSSSLEEVAAPAPNELNLLRALDPEGVFTGKESKTHGR